METPCAPENHLLVLHSGALGDCALALDLIDAVRGASASLGVTLAARSELAQWSAARGNLAGAISLDTLQVHSLYGPASLRPAERSGFLVKFGVILSMLGDPGALVSGALREASGRPVIAIDPAPEKAGPFAKRHITDQWAERIRSEARAIRRHSPLIAALQSLANPSTPASIPVRTREHAKGLVFCHPGSGGLAKCCRLDVFENLVARLKARGMEPRWLIGPAERERFGPEWEDRLRRSAPLLFSDCAAEAADAVEASGAYVGHDAGMTHVAARVGVATVAVFVSTDPRVWRPLGPRVGVIEMSGCKDPGACAKRIERVLDEWFDPRRTAGGTRITGLCESDSA